MLKKRTDHIVRKIADGVYRIDEFGAAYCYLIVGEAKALLIDTGCGYGDLQGCIRRITSLPVVVAVTHGHVDHIGGKTQFPEIYMHPADAGLERFMSAKMTRLIYYRMQKDLKKKGIRPADALPAGPYRTRFLPLTKDTVFALGGKTVRVFPTPGHSRGSCVFLLLEERILFTGDNMDSHLWLFLPGSTTVRQWLLGAGRIRKLAESCTAYSGHEEAAQTKEAMDTLMGAAKELLAHQKERRTWCKKLQIYRKDKGKTYILYRKGRLE